MKYNCPVLRDLGGPSVGYGIGMAIAAERMA